jgi:hypothetical protein
MERTKFAPSNDKVSVGNLIRVARPFALSTLFHLAVLVLLSAIAGSTGTGQHQLSPPERPRLIVRLTADAVNLDSRQHQTSVIDSGYAPVATEPKPNSGAQSTDLPGPSLITVPVDVYYTASEVDARATPITAIELETEEVRMLPLNAIGKIVLKLWIDQSGKVEKISPLATDMSPTITDQAIGAFSNTSYQPAIRHGQPVKTVSVIEINYAENH